MQNKFIIKRGRAIGAASFYFLFYFLLYFISENTFPLISFVL